MQEREQLDLFRALPGDMAPRDSQDLMAFPFFSLAKSRRTAPIDSTTVAASTTRLASAPPTIGATTASRLRPAPPWLVPGTWMLRGSPSARR